MWVFDGVLGWSNKRAGVEFYHSWEDGRWGRRQGHYAEGEPERGGWGRLLADEIERETHGRVEGSDILVVVGTKEEIAAAHDALASQPVPAPEPSARLREVAAIVQRHTHQRLWAMTRFAGPDPEHDCHLCRALVAAGVLTVDEIGAGTRAALAATPQDPEEGTR